MKRVTFAMFYQILRKWTAMRICSLFFLINKLTNDVFLDESDTHNSGCTMKSATFDELQTILQIVYFIFNFPSSVVPRRAKLSIHCEIFVLYHCLRYYHTWPIQLRDEIHSTFFFRLGVTRCPLMPKSFIYSCLVKTLLVVSSRGTLCDVYTS